MDVLERFKAEQRVRWSHFAPLQAQTTMAAGRLVKHARLREGMRVLDVGCGTGVVAVTAARAGAHVTGLDLTPELLAVARTNSATAGVDIDWHEGDVERLPFEPATFDAVVSQFGHMFAPRPDVAIGEMLRVLKPGGTIAFSTWPPELCVGRTFVLIARYMPPAPEWVAPPPLWGVPTVVLERLGQAVTHVVFDRGLMLVTALSLAHNREAIERSAGPVVALVERLGASDPEKLAQFRRDYDAIVADYYDDNVIRQEFLMTRATKI